MAFVGVHFLGDISVVHSIMMFGHMCKKKRILSG